MHNLPRVLREGSNLPPEMDHNRMQIDATLYDQARVWIQSNVDFEEVRTGVMTPIAFIERVVAQSPKELSSAVRVMCAVILGAFVMNQGCAASQMQINTDNTAPDAVQVDKKQDVASVAVVVDEKYKDPEFVLKSLKDKEAEPYKIHESLLKNKEFILNAIKDGNPWIVYYMDDEILGSDEEIAMAVIEKDPRFIAYVYKTGYIHHKKVIKKLIEKGMHFHYNYYKGESGHMIGSFGNIKSDVKYDNSTDIVISKELYSDEDIILAGVNDNPDFFISSFCVQKDKEFIRKVIKKQGNLIRYAYRDLDEELDGEMVLDAFKQDWRNVLWGNSSFLDKSFFKDREFVLKFLDYMPKEVIPKNDREIIFNAVKNINRSFLKEKNIALGIVQLCGVDAIDLLDEPMNQDNDIILAAARVSGFDVLSSRGCSYDAEDAKSDKSGCHYDRETILETAKVSGTLTLKNADKSFRKDAEVAFVAVKDDIRAFELADESLKTDKEFIFKAIESIYQLHKPYQNFYEVDLEDDLSYLKEQIPEQYPQDKKFIATLVKRFGFNVLKYFADECLQSDKEFVIELLNAGTFEDREEWKNGYYWLHECLRDDPDIEEAIARAKQIVIVPEEEPKLVILHIPKLSVIETPPPPLPPRILPPEPEKPKAKPCPVCEKKCNIDDCK